MSNATPPISALALHGMSLAIIPKTVVSLKWVLMLERSDVNQGSVGWDLEDPQDRLHLQRDDAGDTPKPQRKLSRVAIQTMVQQHMDGPESTILSSGSAPGPFASCLLMPVLNSQDQRQVQSQSTPIESRNTLRLQTQGRNLVRLPAPNMTFPRYDPLGTSTTKAVQTMEAQDMMEATNMARSCRPTLMFYGTFCEALSFLPL